MDRSGIILWSFWGGSGVVPGSFWNRSEVFWGGALTAGTARCFLGVGLLSLDPARETAQGSLDGVSGY